MVAASTWRNSRMVAAWTGSISSGVTGPVELPAGWVHDEAVAVTWSVGVAVVVAGVALPQGEHDPPVACDVGDVPPGRRQAGRLDHRRHVLGLGQLPERDPRGGCQLHATLVPPGQHVGG